MQQCASFMLLRSTLTRGHQASSPEPEGVLLAYTKNFILLIFSCCRVASDCGRECSEVAFARGLPCYKQRISRFVLFAAAWSR